MNFYASIKRMWYLSSSSKIHAYTKFGTTSSSKLRFAQDTILYYSRNYVRGQGHSDPKMVLDMPLTKDALKLQMLDSNLNLGRYAPDTADSRN